jgi:hypothetical protein
MNSNIRVFDVRLMKISREPARFLPLEIVVIADSFPQAAEAAVIRANDIVKTRALSGAADNTGVVFEGFTVEDVSSMTVVRENAALARGV